MEARGFLLSLSHFQGHRVFNFIHCSFLLRLVALRPTQVIQQQMILHLVALDSPQVGFLLGEGGFVGLSPQHLT